MGNERSKCQCMVYTGWTSVQCSNVAKGSIISDGHGYMLCGLHLSHYNRGNRIMLKGSPKLYTTNEEAYKAKCREEKKKHDEEGARRDSFSKRYWLEEVAKDYDLTYEEAVARLSKKAKKG